MIAARGQLNEIESESAGEIVEVHGKNGEPVKVGEALFETKERSSPSGKGLSL